MDRSLLHSRFITALHYDSVHDSSRNHFSMADKPHSEELKDQKAKKERDHREEMRLLDKSIESAREAERAEQRTKEQAENSKRELEEMQRRHEGNS
jgi:hypothetical protein